MCLVSTLPESLHDVVGGSGTGPRHIPDILDLGRGELFPCSLGQLIRNGRLRLLSKSFSSSSEILQLERWIAQPVRSMAPPESSESEEQLIPPPQLSFLGDACKSVHQAGVGYQNGAGRVSVGCLPEDTEHVDPPAIRPQTGTCSCMPSPTNPNTPVYHGSMPPRQSE
ncbi:hypothetical protein PIB30_051125 [Stylosanthes scabra]|uniref:Uncharacterized protein n=1 Tax=Stylosanthes scabra TaxID=79078 RepID=A0ABU6XFI5_9FABA|nr:hypothetical protein [Stylosanthes scabra]